MPARQNNIDHDLLIQLHTEVKGIREDIRDLKDNTRSRIEDHETRLRTMEQYKWQAVGVLATLQILMAVVLWYFGR